MRRKSAFFRRVGAMQCVAPQNPRPDWTQCYHLLLQSLEGYNLSVDPQDIPQGQCYGWPIVQIRVLHELIYSARRIGNANVVIRHLCLLLHLMFDELKSEERSEMANVLESYTVKTPGLPKTLSLENGIILPPVHFTKLPVIKRFRLQDAPPHMRPCKLSQKLAKSAQLNSSPFIYSPILSAHGNRDQTDDTKMSFQWVDGDVCEVSLQIFNPMPFELKVSQLGLITTGVEFDSYPISITLPAESGPFPAKIIGTPKDTGTLKVKGYTSTVLGVQSECLLSQVAGVEHDHYSIEVVPRLPQLQVTTTLPKSASFTSVADSASVVNSAQANIYAGESLTCYVTLSNIGKETIEYLTLMLDSKVQPELLNKVLFWDQQELDSQLPLEPNATATFSLNVYGASDFLPLRQMDTLFSPRSKAARWFSGEVGSSDTEDVSDAVILDVLLKFQYSGGPGYVDQYCRQCSLALTVEILPSLVFNKWNVLAEENSQQCHLVFDVENVTSHDITAMYASDGEMVIDARECKRLCIEIDRCEFPRFDEVPLEPRSKYMEGCQVTRQDLYAQHVAQFVDVRWKMHGTENHGKVTIERLRWNMQQIGILSRPPFVWEWWIDDSSYKAGPIDCCLGEEITMRCAITNKSNCDIVDAVLTAVCYQEQGNGTRFQAGEQSVLILGRDSTNCCRMPIQGTLYHEVTLTFLCAGRYRVEGHCSGRRQPSDDDKTETAVSSSKVEVPSSVDAPEQWTCSQLVLNVSE